MPTLIHASVSPKILAKIDRRFTNRLDDLFVELFQNARRAGATHITVTTREVEPIGPDFFHTEITVADNGSGIEDFSALLRLGDSGWDSKVAEREDAAGEGFFSLVHSGVEVTSLKQQATFTKGSFMGHFPVEVKDTEESFAGTRLVFRRADDLKAVEAAARKIALYGHTPCSFNGSELPQEDFLKDALSVKEVNGVRIGVYTRRAYDRRAYDVWNFHGRLLDKSIPSLDNVVVNDRGSADSLYARFDVLETQAIWLKLPDRSDVVEDAKFSALMDEAKIAMYEYMATLPSHCAPFELYTEARALGVELKEASPWFRPFIVAPADSDSDSDILQGDKKLVLADLTTSALVDCRPDCDDLHAFTFAVAAEYFEKLPVIPLLDDASRFTGYSWYGTVPRIHSFDLLIDGVEASEVAQPDDLTLVDTIKLSFRLSNVDQPFTWDLPFASWSTADWTGEDLLMFITRTSPWASRSNDEPFDLVDAAFHVAFSHNDSYDSDSYDSQRDYFYEEHRRNFLMVLGGDTAVIEAELAKVLRSWPLSSLLESEGIREVQLTSRPDGNGWNVELIKAA